MASAQRRTSTSVIARLKDSPQRFDYFQAVQLAVLSLSRSRSELGARRRDPIRFHARTRMGASLPHLCAVDLDAEPPSLTSDVMGLTGAQGVLPLHYSELLLQRRRAKDPTLEHFLGLFNHRTLGLSYQSWLKYRLPRSLEHSDNQARLTRAPVISTLFSLLGLIPEAAQENAPLPVQALGGLGGLLSRRILSSAMLQQLATHLLGLPVEIEQFKGEWLDIPPDLQTRLPGPEHAVGVNCALGQNTILGERNWYVQGRFAVAIHAHDARALSRLRPDGIHIGQLKKLLRFACADTQSFDIVVLTERAFMRPMQLSSDTDQRPMLGWNTMVGIGTAAGKIRINVT
jgi:type VI secretion system protein ImpH